MDKQNVKERSEVDMMVWRKVEKEDEIGKYSGYDVVVRKYYIYFPNGSKIVKMAEEMGLGKYDILIDRERGEVAICLSNNGEFSFPKNRLIRSPKRKVHTVVRIFNEILGIGKYKAKFVGVLKVGEDTYENCYVIGGDEDEGL